MAKCWVSETNSFVAVKIIKNEPAYYQQALVEVSMLHMVIDVWCSDMLVLNVPANLVLGC